LLVNLLFHIFSSLALDS